MAKERGWWKLDVNVEGLTEADLGHIAQMILDGFTEGEIVKDEDETCCICSEKSKSHCISCDLAYCEQHYGSVVLAGNCCRGSEVAHSG